jgi:predicted ribosome quality control (RQC) complex YloA/Tae2 family protein
MKIEQRIDELDRLFKRIYEDFANENLSESRFRMLSDDYEKEQNGLREKLLQLNDEIERQEEQSDNLERFIIKVNKYLSLEELTPDILNDLVKAVYIHTATKEDGMRVQDIEISYDLVGILPSNLVYNLQVDESA